jgi:very-short-patch-repair endonuclease
MADDFLPRNKKLNCHSRSLRNNATKQENHLWFDYLKKHSFQFYRQRIIGEYIVDFYCPHTNLVIEIDGSQHYEKVAIEYDKRRTAYFENLGLIVLRFTNKDIDSNFDGVCQVIEQTILSHIQSSVSLRSPAPFKRSL